MGFKLFILYVLLGFFSQDYERNKSDKPVSLHLETVIVDSDDAILGRFGGATITDAGEILYTDMDQKTILVFDKEGNYMTRFGRSGRGPGEFQTPRNITTDQDGYIYVVDSRNLRISIWNPDFSYSTDIPYRAGAGTQFIQTNRSLFIFTMPFARLPSGYDRVTISEIERNTGQVSPFFTYVIRDWFDVNRPFDSGSNLAMRDDGVFVASGKIDQYPLRLVNTEGEVIREFGKSSEVVYYSEEEMKVRIDAANSIHPEYAARIAQGRKFKHIYSNIEICDRNWLWVHRNKEFGARDEIDIYSHDGEYETIVTIPPSENELQMLGIYGDKVLFHVTTLIGEVRLHVYRINYRTHR